MTQCWHLKCIIHKKFEKQISIIVRTTFPSIYIPVIESVVSLNRRKICTLTSPEESRARESPPSFQTLTVSDRMRTFQDEAVNLVKGSKGHFRVSSFTDPFLQTLFRVYLHEPPGPQWFKEVGLVYLKEFCLIFYFASLIAQFAAWFYFEAQYIKIYIYKYI